MTDESYLSEDDLTEEEEYEWLKVDKKILY